MADVKSSQPRVYAAAQEIGGMNLLRSYLSRLSSQIHFNLEHPAISLIQAVPSMSTLEIINELGEKDKIFVAASIDNRKSQTLPLFVQAKKRKSEFTISLDNWVYFPERLVGVGPTRLIVYDLYAYDYAKKVFGDFHEVELVQNYYLKEICLEVSNHSSDDNSWLFVDARPNVFTLFDRDLHENGCCCTQIEAVLREGGFVTFRPHPSHRRISCENYLVTKYEGQFRLSKESLLYRDLFNHSNVLGSPGYALYVASESGKKVFSTASTNHQWNGPIFERLSDRFL